MDEFFYGSLEGMFLKVVGIIFFAGCPIIFQFAMSLFIA